MTDADLGKLYEDDRDLAVCKRCQAPTDRDDLDEHHQCRGCATYIHEKRQTQGALVTCPECMEERHRIEMSDSGLCRWCDEDEDTQIETVLNDHGASSSDPAHEEATLDASDPTQDIGDMG